MSLDPIFRARRLVLASIILGGGEPRPHQYHRAALAPFDEYVTPWGDSTEQSKLWPSNQAGPTKRPPGPAF